MACYKFTRAIFERESTEVFNKKEEETYADISDIQRDVGFNPTTNIQDGLKQFVKWYREYYKV